MKVAMGTLDLITKRYPEITQGLCETTINYQQITNKWHYNNNPATSTSSTLSQEALLIDESSEHC